jgi:negative regulator of replication initiation
MPTWPLPPGRKTLTLELDEAFVQHLDAQAQYIGCSRAAYLRQLIRKDMDRQGTAPAAA